jgi:hypothetical protein
MGAWWPAAGVRASSDGTTLGRIYSRCRRACHVTASGTPLAQPQAASGRRPRGRPATRGAGLPARRRLPRLAAERCLQFRAAAPSAAPRRRAAAPAPPRSAAGRGPASSAAGRRGRVWAQRARGQRRGRRRGTRRPLPLTVDLLAGDALDVDHKLLAVHRRHLALAPLGDRKGETPRNFAEGAAGRWCVRGSRAAGLSADRRRVGGGPAQGAAAAAAAAAARLGPAAPRRGAAGRGDGAGSPPPPPPPARPASSCRGHRALRRMSPTTYNGRRPPLAAAAASAAGAPSPAAANRTASRLPPSSGSRAGRHAHLEGAADHLHLVILADRHGLHLRTPGQTRRVCRQLRRARVLVGPRGRRVWPAAPAAATARPALPQARRPGQAGRHGAAAAIGGLRFGRRARRRRAGAAAPPPPRAPRTSA